MTPLKWRLPTGPGRNAEYEIDIPFSSILAAAAAMPDPLPPAEVTVTTDYNKLHVRIKRDGGSDRSYQGDGTNEGDRAKDAIKKILADPASIENISRG